MAPGSGSRPLDLDALEDLYPEVECELVHDNAFQLVCATILSAQCTDERVNKVTPDLFAQFPTPEAMARAPLPTLEKLIRSTGFYKQKAKSLKGTATALLERFGGQVPQTIAELTTLPGVARKTANVVLGTSYGIAEGVVVDTHIQRLSMRLALTRSAEPKGIEQDLMKALPREQLDPRRPPDHLARPPGLLRPQAELRRLHPGPLLPVGGAGRVRRAYPPK